jgi:hypothetical protein
VDEMWINFRLIEGPPRKHLKLLELKVKLRLAAVKDFIHTCGLFHVKHS